jgi:hypothetical protein
MEKINKLLNNYDALPNQPNWTSVQETFREKYREAQVIVEEINKAEVPAIEKQKAINELDEKLIEIFNATHDITFNDEGAEQQEELNGDSSQQETVTSATLSDQETEQVKTYEPISESTLNDQTNEILSNFEQSSKEPENNEDMKNKKQEPENINTPDPEINTNSSQQEESNVETETEEVKTDGHLSQPETETIILEQQNQSEQNPFQQFEAFAATQEVIRASDLVRFGIPAELWKENKLEIVIGNVKLEKTIAGALFNTWIVKK